MLNKKSILNLFGFILIFTGITFLYIFICFVYHEKSGGVLIIFAAIVSFCFGILSFFISDGTVREFSLEYGRLKTQITRSEQVISEAHATLEQLRKTALALAEPNFLNLALSGNIIVGLHAASKVQFRNKIASSLKNLGINESEINNVAEEFDKMFDRYHKDKFLKSLDEDMQNNLSEDVNPSMIRSLDLSLSDDSSELLEDWDYFLNRRSLRRPVLWEYHAAG